MLPCVSGLCVTLLVKHVMHKQIAYRLLKTAPKTCRGCFSSCQQSTGWHQQIGIFDPIGRGGSVTQIITCQLLHNLDYAPNAMYTLILLIRVQLLPYPTPFYIRTQKKESAKSCPNMFAAQVCDLNKKDSTRGMLVWLHNHFNNIPNNCTTSTALQPLQSAANLCCEAKLLSLGHFRFVLLVLMKGNHPCTQWQTMIFMGCNIVFVKWCIYIILY